MEAIQFRLLMTDTPLMSPGGNLSLQLKHRRQRQLRHQHQLRRRLPHRRLRHQRHLRPTRAIRSRILARWAGVKAPLTASILSAKWLATRRLPVGTITPFFTRREKCSISIVWSRQTPAGFYTVHQASTMPDKSLAAAKILPAVTIPFSMTAAR